MTPRTAPVHGGTGWPAALGALAGQVTLAAGSLVLQVVAARALGAADFGVFALLFGAIVMATAVSTGLVGDSLTVLDRRDPAIRWALTRCAAGAIAAAAVAGPVLAAAAVGLGLVEALAFGAACAAFMAADLGRRLLMGALRFWRLVLVDTVSFGAAVSVLVVASAAGRLTLAAVLGAIAAGQTAACVTALACLPRDERSRPRPVSGGVREVLAFGTWRALQQFVRPTTLNLCRWLVLLAAGAAAVGQLEAARLVVAPAMLLVQGLGSYLFASYAADRSESSSALLDRADRAAAVMLGGALVVTAVVATALPVLEPLLGAGYHLPIAAVLGWGWYAGSCAAVLPYGSLAAVRGRQAAVLGFRAADAALALALVALVVPVLGGSPDAAPWLLAGGSFVGGLLCRQLLLQPLTTAPPCRSPREVAV